MSELPNGWRQVTLSEVAASCLGKMLDRQKHTKGKPLPYLRNQNVRWFTVDESDVLEMLFEDDELDRYAISPGDILICEGGEPGRAAIWDGRTSTMKFQKALHRVRPSAALLPEWLVFRLWHDARSGRLERYFTGTTIKHFTGASLAKFELPLPPVEEQRRIVARLETLQARSRSAREALDAVPPLIEKLRQSILAAAFRGDLTKDWRAKNKNVEPATELLARIRLERRKKWEESELAKMKAKGKPPAEDKWKSKYNEPAPVDTTGLPELPEGWCWAAWREVGFSQNGRSFPSSEYSSDGEKLLRPGNLHSSGRLDWTGANTRRMPNSWAQEYPDFVVGENELLMNLTAQSLKDEFLGRVCLSGPGERCLLNQRIARLTPVGVSPRYCLWFFKSPQFRRYVDTLNTGSLIQHMFTSQLDEFAVPLAPLAEAKVLVERVGGRIEALRATAATVETQSNQLPDLARAVLAKAFRGELVPQSSIVEEPRARVLGEVSAEGRAT